MVESPGGRLPRFTMKVEQVKQISFRVDAGRNNKRVLNTFLRIALNLLSNGGETSATT